MGAPTKSTKAVVVMCTVCGQPKKTITVIINGKKKTCKECGCGIFDKSGRKID